MQTICQYLIDRLYSLGVKEFLGVPGDFNFEILDAVEDNPNTKWIGCCNELNAAYAADGYGKIKGLAACITTYGVGELSAINGIAGAYAQDTPVIKIVGMPKSEILCHGVNIHHSLGNGEWDAYFKAYKNFTEYAAILNEENAFEEIEKAIHIAKTEKKPVYIGIPQDVAQKEIKRKDFHTPKEEYDNAKVAQRILEKLKTASKPILMLDSLIYTFQLTDKITTLVNTLKIPYITTTMGKASVDEDNPYFGGVFVGNLLNPCAQELYETSDCILAFGLVWTDFNIGFFSIPKHSEKIIEIEKHSVIAQNEVLKISSPGDLLDELIKQATSLQYNFKEPETEVIEIFSENTQLECKNLAPLLQEFFKPNDLIVSETGMSDLGIINCKFPQGARPLIQSLYSSIGWATPAAFGAALAERTRRVILLTGDGSLQITVQEISSICRYGLRPIIFLINNSGYTIERLLSKNPMNSYNDIAHWNWEKLPELFCQKFFYAKINTTGELDEALKVAEKGEQPCIIELILDKMDMPPLAKRLRKRLEG